MGNNQATKPQATAFNKSIRSGRKDSACFHQQKTTTNTKNKNNLPEMKGIFYKIEQIHSWPAARVYSKVSNN